MFRLLVYYSEINQWCICGQKQPPEVFYKKGFLRNFAKFAGKHPCQSLFFKKRDSGTGVFLRIYGRLPLCGSGRQGHIQNPVKHLRWKISKNLFYKSSILDGFFYILAKTALNRAYQTFLDKFFVGWKFHQINRGSF